MTALEAMRAVFEAWEAGDPDALRALFSEDGVYLDPLKAGPLEGREAIVEDNRPAMAAIEDCRITVGLELEDGDSAVVEGVLRLAPGRHRRAVRLSVRGGRELSGGRIKRLAEYFDTRPLVP